MKKFEKSAWREAAVLTQAATPEGFVVTDFPEVFAPKTAHKVCERLLAKGRLHQVTGHRIRARYFCTPAQANAYRASPPPASERRVTPPAPPAPRKPSRTAAVLIPQQTRAQELLLRSPMTQAPAAPRKDAEIVHTMHTLYSSRTMPPPRNTTVTHSFIHGGMGAM